jgi:hypothetical protein
MDEVADHLLTFDGGGEALVIDDACRQWLSRAEETLVVDSTQLEEPSSSANVTNDALITATLLSLDQVLALCVRQNPVLSTVAWKLRRNLHSAVFVNPSASAGRPTRVIVGRSRSALADEEALDDYRDRCTFQSACRHLLDENRKATMRTALAQLADKRHHSAVEMLLRGQQNATLIKSFCAWRGLVRGEREQRRLAADWAVEASRSRDQEQKILGELVKCQQELRQCKMKLEFADRACQQLNTIDHAHERKLGALRDEIAALKNSLARADERHAKAELVKSFEIAEAECMWRKAFLEMRPVSCNSYENRLREHFDPAIYQTREDLLLWARHAVALRGGRWASLSDKLPSAPLAFLVLLHVMSPGQLPSTALSRAVAGSIGGHTDALSHYISSVKIRVDVDVKKLPESKEVQDKLLMAFFERFCGLQAETPLKAPDFVDDVNYWAAELDMSPASLAPPELSGEQGSVEACVQMRALEAEAAEKWMAAFCAVAKSQ